MSISPPKVTLGATRKKPARLSKNGRWRSFPRVPHLLQHVSIAECIMQGSTPVASCFVFRHLRKERDKDLLARDAPGKASTALPASGPDTWMASLC
jgi:hypothetical protein